MRGNGRTIGTYDLALYTGRDAVQQWQAFLKRAPPESVSLLASILGRFLDDVRRQKATHNTVTQPKDGVINDVIDKLEGLHAKTQKYFPIVLEEYLTPVVSKSLRKGKAFLYALNNLFTNPLQLSDHHQEFVERTIGNLAEYANDSRKLVNKVNDLLHDRVPDFSKW